MLYFGVLACFTGFYRDKADNGTAAPEELPDVRFQKQKKIWQVTASVEIPL